MTYCSRCWQTIVTANITPSIATTTLFVIWLAGTTMCNIGLIFIYLTFSPNQSYCCIFIFQGTFFLHSAEAKFKQHGVINPDKSAFFVMGLIFNLFKFLIKLVVFIFQAKFFLRWAEAKFKQHGVINPDKSQPLCRRVL